MKNVLCGKHVSNLCTGLLGLLLLSSFTMSGCGGSQNPKSTASTASTTAQRTTKATVTVAWPTPAQSRLIPVASNSLRITITNMSGFAVSKVIARPETSATFDKLPPGALTITATAHADAAGEAKPAQASGVQVVEAVADKPFTIPLTLASTIDHLQISAASTTATIGQSLLFGASAVDAEGALVLTSGTTYQWSVSDTTVATLQPISNTAILTGVAEGTTTATVTETESGKSATLTLAVKPTPATPTPPPAETPTSTPTPTPTPTPAPEWISTSAITFQIDAGHSGAITFDKPLTYPEKPLWSAQTAGNASYPVVGFGQVAVAATSPSASPSDSQGHSYSFNAATGQERTDWSLVLPLDKVGLRVSLTLRAFDFPRQGQQFFYPRSDGYLSLIELSLPGRGTFAPSSTTSFVQDSPITFISNRLFRLISRPSESVLIGQAGANTWWEASVKQGSNSAPTVATDLNTVFVSYPGQVYAFNVDTGAPLWHVDDGGDGGIGTTSVYANGKLYVRDPKNGNAIYDARSGSKIGTFPATQIPAIGKEIGVFLENGVLRGIKLSSNEVLWTFTGDGSLNLAPIIINDAAFVASRSGTVYALDLATGKQLWTGSAGAPIADTDEMDMSRSLTGFGAGEGYLAVPAGNRITVWRLTAP